MFGREAVVDGDNNGGCLTSESATGNVIGFGIGVKEGETSAVEENDDRKRFIGGGGSCRDEEAEPEISGWIDGDIEGFDAINRFGIRRSLEVEVTE